MPFGHPPPRQRISALQKVTLPEQLLWFSRSRNVYVLVNRPNDLHANDGDASADLPLDVQPHTVEARRERGRLVSWFEPYSRSPKEEGGATDIREPLLAKQDQAGGDQPVGADPRD